MIDPYDRYTWHKKGGWIMKQHGSGHKRNGSHKSEQIMTLREVAHYLGLHIMTVYKLTREGRVPAAKIGGQWRFKRDVLDEWLEAEMHRNAAS